MQLPVEERDTAEPRDLAPPHVGTLEVRVQEHVEVEGGLLARVVHPDVEVQLLLPQDDPVGDPEVVLPHGEGKVTVTQGEDGLNVTRGQPLGALVQLPAADPGEPVVRRAVVAVHPVAELREYEGDPPRGWACARRKLTFC